MAGRIGGESGCFARLQRADDLFLDLAILVHQLFDAVFETIALGQFVELRLDPGDVPLLVLAGVPEWWYVLGPFGAPLLVLAAALMIAYPDSRWARFFYGERKMHRAVEVHGLDSLSPTG